MQLRYYYDIKIGAKLIPFWNWKRTSFVGTCFILIPKIISTIFMFGVICAIICSFVYIILWCSIPWKFTCNYVLMCLWMFTNCSNWMRQKKIAFSFGDRSLLISNALSARALAFELVKSTNEISFSRGEKRT